VDAIFDYADSDRIATALMQRVQDGDPNVADALLKLLDGVPTDAVMAAQHELPSTDVFDIKDLKPEVLLAVIKPAS
jgi:hypothetical protein